MERQNKLLVVNQLTDKEIETRRLAIKQTGEVECLQCGWTGRDKRYIRGIVIAGELIDHGVFSFNKETNRYDNPSGSGVVVRECPKCHYIDNEPRLIPGSKGFKYKIPQQPQQGEWVIVSCNKVTCTDFGKPFLLLSCPGCKKVVSFHSNNGNNHYWTLDISDNKLNVTPSLFHDSCKFSITNNEVTWL